MEKLEAVRTAVVLQSNYIPWKGYFDLISEADIFVFYDDVQYTSRDWRSRNKIKTARGAEWISVPVGAHINRRICDTKINDIHWQMKHWRAIQHSYSKSRYFDIYRELFESIYLGHTWNNLSELNQHCIKLISKDLLGLSTKFCHSSDYEVSGGKLDRLVEIVRKTGATRYISGPAAKDYIDPLCFAEVGIELVWKDYSGYPEYPQRFQPFEHGVSILDLLFNVGPNAPWYIWGWREGGSAPE